MKKLALIVWLLIAILGHAEEDKPLLEGWGKSWGEWAKEQDGVRGILAFLQWDGDAEKQIDIQFLLTIKKWGARADSETPGTCCIIWNAEDGVMAAGGQNPEQPRNLAVLYPNKLYITSQPKRPDTLTSSVPYTPPVGKPIKCRARITKKGIQIVVGKAKATADIPSEKLGKLQLHVNGPEVIFSKVKVKAK